MTTFNSFTSGRTMVVRSSCSHKPANQSKYFSSTDLTQYSRFASKFMMCGSIWLLRGGMKKYCDKEVPYSWILMWK